MKPAAIVTILSGSAPAASACSRAASASEAASSSTGTRVERSLWLTTTVLAGKFRDELEQRPQRELVPGERIVVTRLGKATGGDGTTEYWNYRVLFPDKPSLSTSDLFDFEGEPPRQAPQQQPKPEEPAPATAQDDDDGIPF
jgi:hypothetical protein